MYLSDFAAMAKSSKALDGDWQGDGWGLAYLDDTGSWVSQTSVKPVWEEKHIFPRIPESSFFLVHARSASFAQHKETLEYNQPFVHGKYAFVFNGLLKGVTLPYSVPGKIGSQKIWSILKTNLETMKPQDALKKTVKTLNTYTREIQAMNIGLADGKNIYTYCQYSGHPEYYNLHCCDTEKISVVCSEKLVDMDLERMATEKVIML